ncbi:hypothetical protein QBC44DRAFT_372983 [Cladorrhinum sp. PSN332]|nr:hypothetical protein QBC44DRAFT_372983 [Cladorrhinum sp. PSN332]
MAPVTTTNMAAVAALFHTIINANQFSFALLHHELMALGVLQYTFTLTTNQLVFRTLLPAPNPAHATVEHRLSLATVLPACVPGIGDFSHGGIDLVVDQVRREGATNFLGFVWSLLGLGVVAVAVTPADGHATFWGEALDLGSGQIGEVWHSARLVRTVDQTVTDAAASSRPMQGVETVSVLGPADKAAEDVVFPGDALNKMNVAEATVEEEQEKEKAKEWHPWDEDELYDQDVAAAAAAAAANAEQEEEQ